MMQHSVAVFVALATAGSLPVVSAVLADSGYFVDASAVKVPVSVHAAGAWQGVTGALSAVLLETGVLSGFEVVNQTLTSSYAMEEVAHSKKKGEGYLRGSPLYDKQKELELRREKENNVFMQILAFWHAALFIHTIGTSVFYVGNFFLVLVVAYVYKNYKPSAFVTISQKEIRTKSWAYHAFDLRDLHTDWPICCMACWCPAIRWADTIGSDSVRPQAFWPAFFLFFILQLLGPLTFGCSSLVALCIGIYCRHEIRRKFHKTISWKSSFWDGIFWCCFPCCAIAQEAREVEKVQPPTLGEGQSQKLVKGVYENNSNAN